MKHIMMPILLLALLLPVGCGEEEEWPVQDYQEFQVHPQEVSFTLLDRETDISVYGPPEAEGQTVTITVTSEQDPNGFTREVKLGSVGTHLQNAADKVKYRCAMGTFTLEINKETNAEFAANTSSIAVKQGADTIKLSATWGEKVSSANYSANTQATVQLNRSFRLDIWEYEDGPDKTVEIWSSRFDSRLSVTVPKQTVGSGDTQFANYRTQIDIDPDAESNHLDTNGKPVIGVHPLGGSQDNHIFILYNGNTYKTSPDGLSQLPLSKM